MSISANTQGNEINLANVATILLAGGKGARLHDLTAHESKPALFFAGRSRLIDFAMANVVRSGMERLLVATQYAPATLQTHLPQRWGQYFLPENFLIRDGRDRYQGTADAVRNNWSWIGREKAGEILVLAADHVYDFDYAGLIAHHRASGAEVTVAVDVVPQAEASGFGVLDVLESGKIVSFLEKPANPPAIRGEPGRSLVSMGIYVFSQAWLERALFGFKPEGVDFGHEIVPLAVAQGVAGAFRLLPSDGDDAPYWRDVGTLDAYRLAQLDFVANQPVQLPTGYPSCQWYRNRGSILMPGARADDSVRLTNTIVAPDVHLPPGLVVGEDPGEDRKWFRTTPGGTILITQKMLERRKNLRARKTAIVIRPGSSMVARNTTELPSVTHG